MTPSMRDMIEKIADGDKVYFVNQRARMQYFRAVLGARFNDESSIGEFTPRIRKMCATPGKCGLWVMGGRN